MRIFVLVLGLALYVRGDTTQGNNQEEDNSGILQCVFENSIGHCFRKRLARELDEIELKITKKKTEPPLSAVIERAGDIIAEFVDDLQESGTEGLIEKDDSQDGNRDEARKKKKKKKKKHVGKLVGLAMLVKSKISVLLQMISLHFQKKFLVIAIISLILNTARFWIELKKKNPSKVIYYESAQHQHHYDNDDHDWGRSSNETPQDIAYRAYIPEE